MAKGAKMERTLFHADFISQFRQHGQVFPDGDAGGGEHISGDGGIRSGHEDFPAVVLHGVPSGGDADEAVRHDEPHQGHDAQLFFLSQGGHVRVRRSGDGGQKVDGHGFDAQRRDVHVHVYPVFHSLSKPHNAATANFQPGFQSPFDGLQFVVVRMGGADIREIAAGSFQIIVVA